MTMPPPPQGQPPQPPNQPYGAPPPAAPPAGAQWGAPPPPPPAPAAYPPPAAPPAYGPPQGGYPAPAQGFDPKTVNPLDWGIIGAGVLTFLLSFFSYYTYKVSFKGGGINIASGTVTWNAWHGFFGWFGMVCAVIGSAAVAVELFAPQVKLPVPARLAGLGAYAVATLCLLLALVIVPGNTGGADAFGVHVNKGHAFGYWLSLLIVLAGLVLSLMRFQAKGGKLPGALGNIPNIGGHGPQ